MQVELPLKYQYKFNAIETIMHPRLALLWSVSISVSNSTDLEGCNVHFFQIFINQSIIICR